MLKDKVIQLKASVSVMRDEKHGRGAPVEEKHSRDRTRSKERESKSSKERSKAK